MEWIIKIEDDNKQRIRIEFNPMLELIIFFGEIKIKGNQWTIFSQIDNKMEISLEEIITNIERIIIKMRERLKVYQNLDEGFNVLKIVDFK